MFYEERRKKFTIQNDKRRKRIMLEKISESNGKGKTIQTIETEKTKKNIYFEERRKKFTIENDKRKKRIMLEKIFESKNAGKRKTIQFNKMEISKKEK